MSNQQETLFNDWRYLFSASGKVTPTVVRELIEQVFEERGGEIVMTVAEQLIQQGMELGMERGMERGGVLAMQQTVNALMSHRFGTPSFSLQERVTYLNERQLRQLSIAILDAQSLEDVQRQLDDIE